MSATKRLAMFMKLISEKPCNSVEIKGRLGIDKRTSCRYVKTLKDAGYDVKSSPGPNGGYYLKL